MSYYASRRTGRGRPGMVLLIVIAMLALFAGVALGAVFYAESAATSSSLTRQGLDLTQPDADPELLLSYFLGQLIYDTDNVNSSMRGHSLARTMYGYNPNRLNKDPYSGTGRFHYTLTDVVWAGQDNVNLVNYQSYPSDFTAKKAAPLLRDPEFFGTRDPTKNATPIATSFRAGNAPYTYPDLNNMFLAIVSADGEVLQQSFYRNWTGVDFTKTNPNTDWLQKYLTLVPHGVYHPGFAFGALPDADKGGHVRNLDYSKGFRTGNNTYAYNDSYWMDLGWPVMTAPNGKKYKVLFAPLVIDLDYRLNLFVTGNASNGGNHASNRGYGQTEINLSKVPIANNINNYKNDLKWLFGKRTFGNPLTSWPIYDQASNTYRDGPKYAAIDFDGQNQGKLTLPQAGQYFIFPGYPDPTKQPTWYTGSGTAKPGELANHPLSDTTWAGATGLQQASQMEAILRYLGTNTPAATSDLFMNMPNILGNARARNLLTSLSWSLDRVTAAPYINFNPTNGTTYTYNAALLYPQLTANNGNGLVTLNPNPAANPQPPIGDYTSEWRSTLVSRLRYNLNKLSLGQYDYPAPAGNDQIDSTSVRYLQAVSQRQQMAKDLYNLLILVTGAQDPMQVKLTTGSAQYKAARWLAQLAVNMVDFIDSDDYMTPFAWNTPKGDGLNGTDVNGNPIEWLFGTEQPRVVLNEIYAQTDNDPADPGLANKVKKATTARLSTWIELLNPFMNTAGQTWPIDGGVAKLEVAGSAAYEVIVETNDAGLRNIGNFRGNTGGTVIATINNWGNNNAVQNTIQPNDGNFSGKAGTNQNGFYLLGPAAGKNGVPLNYLAGSDPQFPAATFLNTRLSTTYQIGKQPTSVTVLVRRLANPHLPLQNTFPPGKGQTPYNPYVTIDYVQNVTVQNNQQYDANGSITPGNLNSVGRKQPYAANQSQQAAQQWNNPKSNPGPIPNTFFQHNNPLANPFDWLVHLDRPLVNPLELLHVSGFRPHELTQQFYDANGRPFQHYAPWQDPQALIYRLLELVEAPPNLNGTCLGGRQPGKVNINTLFGSGSVNYHEVWRALCDAQGTSSFTENAADTLFSNLIQSRTPGNGVPGPNDRPFKSFATGYVANGLLGEQQYVANGSGIDDTLLRTTSSPPNKPAAMAQPPYSNLLFATGAPNNGAASTHPYIQTELLQKIANNVTTTSHVFAVWLTAGFFEVQDIDAQGNPLVPPLILSEIGRDQGRHIRHRMFAIIDRSQLQLFRDTGGTYKVQNGQGTLSFTVPSSVGSLVQVGDVFVLEVNNGTTTEATTVTATANQQNKTAWTFNVTLQTITNNATVTVVCRGNPGPWPAYNPRSDPAVVPFFSVIQ